jgi:hypothetical protein
MLSAVIPVFYEEPALLDTLAALAPAAAEGMIRDVALATPGASEFTRTVADAAGCAMIEGPADRAALLANAGASMRADWILVLEQGFVPAAGWMGAVSDFIMEQTTDEPRSAVLTLAQGRGWTLRERWINLQTDLFGNNHPAQGLVVHRDLCKASRVGRAVRLPCAIHDRRGRACKRA